MKKYIDSHEHIIYTDDVDSYGQVWCYHCQSYVTPRVEEIVLEPIAEDGLRIVRIKEGESE